MQFLDIINKCSNNAPIPKPMQESNTNNSANLIDDLNSFMDDFLEEDLEVKDVLEEKQPMNNERANYLVNSCNKMRKEIADVNELCDKEIKRQIDGINSFREKRTKELENSIDFIESILYRYLLSETANKKIKKIKLPSGTLSIKKATNKFVYDDQKLMDFINTNAKSYIKEKITYSVDKTELKKSISIIDDKAYIGDTLIDGIEITKQDEKLVIK